MYRLNLIQFACSISEVSLGVSAHQVTQFTLLSNWVRH